MHRRVEDVSPIAQDGKEKGCGQEVAEVVGEAHPRGGEAFDYEEGGMGFAQPFGAVGGCGN